MSESRPARKKSQSYPRIDAQGWQDEEPTQLLEKGLDKLTKTASEGEAEIARASLAATASAKRMSETAKKVAAG